jgi:hypothetical protein
LAVLEVAALSLVLWVPAAGVRAIEEDRAPPSMATQSRAAVQQAAALAVEDLERLVASE